MRTVSGQYISYNEANGQYYLDVKKDIDFDAQIRQRGNLMGNDELNRYFFDALRQVLNLSDTTYVTGHRIWFYELPWPKSRSRGPATFSLARPTNAAQPSRRAISTSTFCPPSPQRVAGRQPGRRSAAAPDRPRPRLHRTGAPLRRRARFGQ
jgi:hypothetical protein